MIEPIGSRVLIKPKKMETTTKAGIYLPSNKDQNQQIGKVIAVGEGHMLENGTRASLMVKKDDLVIFSKFAGTNITDNDESYLLIEERDILAKIHN
ncbi:co-chaperone GroES [Megamonas rupellensis]|jgi:chaperonin GroES|uniref:Co-chaperonin GroES n=2 Tax=Megamonas TaxID=158846 RepID=A0A378NRT3_9FIRM|nr:MULTISPECIES: co-chaperone GroES [Megamonas]RGQ08525.1 co-chaperone GroES [Megamonas rupellensis]STY71093.1 co-chaperonin GroES [Megamonas hypermegale]